MDSVQVAVIGTLGGVAITAAAGLGTALLTGRHQRLLLQLQFEREDATRLRADVKATYVEFLSAYDAVFNLAHLVVQEREPDATADADGLSLPWIKVAASEMGRLKSAYLTLGILAPAPVREAAGDCIGTMWELGDAAVSGDLGAFERAGLATKGPRDAVRAAMRDDLGVS